jgi:hypothetical protein
MTDMMKMILWKAGDITLYRRKQGYQTVTQAKELK